MSRNTNEIDEFFASTESTTKIVDKPVENISPSKEEKPIDTSEEKNQRLQEPETFKASKFGNDLPTLPKTDIDIPFEFKDVVDRVNLMYEALPSIAYNEIYSELSGLGVKPTTGYIPSEIGKQLEQIQAAKDRVSEIYITVDRHCVMKKACVTTLKNVWFKFCKEGNKEKREGEASFIIHNYVLDFAKIEALESTCRHVWANLESAHKILTNKISIMQVTAKMDYGSRNINMDYDFGKTSSMSLISKNNSENNSEEKFINAPEAEEKSF
jgi:hypothetical protein